MKTRLGRTSVIWAALITGLSALVMIGAAFSQIGIGQSEGKEQGTESRTLEILDVGYKLPIEIVAVRNLQSKHWVEHLELEIKNISNKRMYEVYITLFLPDDKDEDGSLYAMSLEYGRIDLIHPRHRATPDDKPIAPGQTVLLKFDERLSKGYEHHLMTKSVPGEASYKVRMIIQTINFGDGTRFINGGAPYPRGPVTVPRPQRYLRIPA